MRQLERRRVLAASITDIFFAPADLDPGTDAHDSNEGTQVTATASASGTGPLTYAWQLLQGDTVITQTLGTSFVFTPLDDGVYTVTLKVTDGAQTAATRSEQLIVHNVAPQLTNVVGDTINEGQTADIFVTIVDPGALDVFEIDVDWKDGDPIDTITGLGLLDASGTVGNTAYEWTAATRLLKLSHQYLDDNPTGTPSDVYHVTLVARDNGLGESEPVVANVVVNNVRPVLHVAPDQVVNEGELLDLSGVGAPPLAVFIDP
ncbi:MAG TPA: PKD domain-containing protein, partial [Actinotalea sp.]|nr:PKD domain-containing protein [Actinotalea sp.]